MTIKIRPLPTSDELAGNLAIQGMPSVTGFPVRRLVSAVSDGALLRHNDTAQGVDDAIFAELVDDPRDD